MKPIRCVIHTHTFTGEHRVFFINKGKIVKKVRPNGPIIETGYPHMSIVLGLSGAIPVYVDERLEWNGKVCHWQPETMWSPQAQL